MIAVVDASAIGAVLLPDEDSGFARFARDICADHAIHAPSHWPVEMANLIWKAARRGRIGSDALSSIVDAASMFVGSAAIAPDVAMAKLVGVARETGLTAYDTAYLLLAETMQAPLLTADSRLASVTVERRITTVLRP